MLPGSSTSLTALFSRLWKSFKTTGMCSRRHGEVVLEGRRLQKTDISSISEKGTGASQLSRQVAVRNYPPTNKNTLIRGLTEEWDTLPQQLLDNVVQSGVALYRPFEEFSRAKSYCHLYGAQRQRQGYFLSHVTINFVGLDLTTSDRISDSIEILLLFPRWEVSGRYSSRGSSSRSNSLHHLQAIKLK
ncbi:hypothetical protein TNCV_1124981 [Trichonephila clavipes]|uniref:Uncharacterized protein n=1 Tax=Trichonephila clavipes TaxID=2585209 RepID=A0A8X6SKY7_TRICX|nr:hypothetical protein TNCV_1124981 [Trichonephila clavipes]